MKNILYRLSLITTAALALLGCAKELEGPAEQGGQHTVTVTLSKPAGTKTAVVEGPDGASYKWLDNDKQYLHVYENGTEGTISSFSLNSDKTIATLTVAFNGTPSAPYTYEAKYAKTLSNSKNPLVLAEQDPGTNTFDPAADVLVSKATPDVTELGDRATEFSFTMGRIVTVNKMTLVGLEAGEVISSVEFSLSKNITGYASFDEGTSSYKFTNGGPKITMNYTTATGTVPANGEFPVYFISAPVDNAGIVSVVVTTDKNVYTKSSSLDPNPFDGKTITFAVGTMTRFSMGLSGYGEEISTAVDYTLVTSAADLPDIGDIIIVNAAGGQAIGGQNSNNRGQAAVPSAVNNVISLTNSSQAHIFTLTLTKDGYLISDKDGTGYLFSASTSSNYLRTKTEIEEASYWDLIYTDTALEITNKGNSDKPFLRYNSSSSCFSCYASGQAPVSIYVNLASVLSILETPTILADVSGNDIEVTWTDVANASSYLVTCTGQENQTINSGVEYAKFENLAEGVYEITVTAKTTTTGYVESAPAVESGIFIGTPTLSAPSIVSLSQTTTGFSATWTASENATSYDWALYSDSGLSTVVASGNVAAVTLASDVTLNSGTTYYFTVIAKATGYNDSPASTAASFTAETLVAKEFTAADYHNANSLTVKKSVITGTFAKGGGTANPDVNSTRVRLYQNNSNHQGGTLTISSTSANIKRVEFSFDGSNTYLTSDTGTYSSGVWTTSTAVSSIEFYCNGTSSSQRADIASFTVYYVSNGPEQLEMGAITCDDNGENENSLTFSWSAVDNATGYQISTNGGNTYGSTQTGLTYTLSNLNAGTTHTIWVKAIGDGTSYLSSDGRESASGTTKSNDGGHDTDEITTGTFTSANSQLTLITDKGVKIVQSKVSGNTNVNANYNTVSTLRVYKGHALTFSGKTFTRIEIVVNGEYYGNKLTASSGTLTPTSTSGGTIVWEGESDSVTITNTATETNTQLRTTSFSVTY